MSGKTQIEEPENFILYQYTISYFFCQPLNPFFCPFPHGGEAGGAPRLYSGQTYGQWPLCRAWPLDCSSPGTWFYSAAGSFHPHHCGEGQPRCPLVP